MTKPKRKSKLDLWQELVAEAREAANEAEQVQDQLATAKQRIVDVLDQLAEMAQEYGDTYDNMNEGLQQSPFGQKCEAMQQLDLAGTSADDELDELISKLDEAEGAEIPLGFGRD